jgi:penicillin-binding protein 2
MFIFDQLKREDYQLQVIAVTVAAGMLLLLGGLWYVQVVSAQKYMDKMQGQTFRSVRLPGTRGRICDRNGRPLADNYPRYDLDIYTEELLAPYNATNTTKADYRRAHGGVKKLNTNMLAEIARTDQSNRFNIVNDLTVRVSSALENPVMLRPDRFFYHLSKFTYVPLPILTDLSQRQLARYYEKLSTESAIDLDVQPFRYYTNAAAHVLGYVRSQAWGDEDEDGTFQYYLPYWKGKTGLENAYDKYLRGKAGVKWVLVNNYSFRQREEIKAPTEAGQDLYLTIDYVLQSKAEEVIARIAGDRGAAAVVMDVRNGDILVLASSPTYDANMFTRRISNEENARLLDEKLRPTYNRATGSYHPGSIFKIITSIACLESGLDPMEVYTTHGGYPVPHRKPIHDYASAGDYTFERAFYKSSNEYFDYFGCKAGSRKLLEVGKRFHLGESTELGIGPEASGFFPKPEEMATKWKESDLPYACIGQAITMTPVQMAAMISVIANGGSLYWPRIVSHLKDPDTGEIDQINPPGRLRDTVQLNPKHLEAIRHAMLMDTESPEGTAHRGFFESRSPLLANFQIAGKTGTAEREENGVKDSVTWFASYGPYANPRYAVIVMVEAGTSHEFGATYCVPISEKIWEAVVKSEQAPPRAPTPLALN